MDLLSTYLTVIMVMLVAYPFVLIGLRFATSDCDLTQSKITNRFNYGFALVLLVLMIAHIQTETFHAVGLLELFRPE